MPENTSNNPVQEQSLSPDKKIEMLAAAIMDLTARIEALESGLTEHGAGMESFKNETASRFDESSKATDKKLNDFTNNLQSKIYGA